jgi:hypothetical protein
MRATIRRLAVLVMLIACFGGSLLLIPSPASANEEMSDCLDAGHGTVYCLWRVYMCRILTHCGGDYPW